MKRSIAFALSFVLLLGLAACGGSSGSTFGVEAEGESSVLVTADNAVTDSTGRTTFTVGEGEQVTIEADFNEDGQIKVRFALGDFVSGTLPEEAVETIVSGGDASSFTMDPGEYTIEVITVNTVTGTARIFTEPAEVSDLPDGDANYYSGVTAMPKEDVEAFACKAKEAYLSGDWETLSKMIAYPISLYPDVTANNAEEFLAYASGKTVHPSDYDALGQDDCADMFVNGQGICLGSGQLWLNDLSYMTDNAPDLRVIAVSGLE